MAFITDDYGNITLVQGDSGKLTVSGIPTDKNYKVYLAIQNDKRQLVGFELKYDSNGQDTVVISFPPSLTNLLTVKRNEETAEYYYGIKICDETQGREEDFEDTLLIGNSELGDVNTITVYPKKVEGTDNTVTNTANEEEETNG